MTSNTEARTFLAICADGDNSFFFVAPAGASREKILYRMECALYYQYGLRSNVCEYVTVDGGWEQVEGGATGGGYEIFRAVTAAANVAWRATDAPVTLRPYGQDDPLHAEADEILHARSQAGVEFDFYARSAGSYSGTDEECERAALEDSIARLAHITRQLDAGLLPYEARSPQSFGPADIFRGPESEGLRLYAPRTADYPWSLWRDERPPAKRNRGMIRSPYCSESVELAHCSDCVRCEWSLRCRYCDDCTGCTDCRYCDDCVDCVDCFSCTECVGITGLENCYRNVQLTREQYFLAIHWVPIVEAALVTAALARSCSDCADCADCSDCTDCTDCTQSADCADCTRCHYCYDCTDCTDCSHCYQCVGLKSAMNVYQGAQLTRPQYDLACYWMPSCE